MRRIDLTVKLSEVFLWLTSYRSLVCVFKWNGWTNKHVHSLNTWYCDGSNKKIRCLSLKEKWFYIKQNRFSSFKVEQIKTFNYKQTNLNLCNMLHSLNQKNVPTLCVARIRCCEKAKRKLVHLEGWEGPKGQTIRFTLCLLVETVLLSFTQWQHNSFCQGLSEAHPWGLLRTWPLLAGVWNSRWARLHCWAIFMGLGSHASGWAAAPCLLPHTTVKSLCLLYSLWSVPRWWERMEELWDAPETIPPLTWASLGL